MEKQFENVKTTKKHNGIIGIWKFLFSLLILAFHITAFESESHTLFSCGAIGVDFFFLVSGYLLAKKVAGETRRLNGAPCDIPKSTWKFLLGKIRVFYPYLLVAFLVLFVIRFLQGQWSIREYLDSTNDLLLLQTVSVKSQRMVGASWYLSAMLVAMLIIYPMMKKFQRTFSLLIAPSACAVLGGYLLYTQASIRSWNAWAGILCVGLFKAFLEIAFGCFVYEASEKLRKTPFTMFSRILLGIGQTAAFVFVFYMNTRYDWVRRLDWLFIVLLAAGVAVAFSDTVPWTGLCSNRLFAYLEKLSTPIFLNNYVGILFVDYMKWFSDSTWWVRLLGIVAVVIVFSIIECAVLDVIQKFNGTKVKRLFIRNVSAKE